MFNFSLFNPVKIVFGKGSVAEISQLIKPYKRVLFAYGGGSIKRNGVYEQVKNSLANVKFFEFSGIEANPEYETLMKAVKIVREQDVDFILAVGGGSVIDGCKFIAHAALFSPERDPWEILTKRLNCRALPIGTVLTLSATGTEMNSFSVVSRRELKEKRDFSSENSYPKFSILDPEFTYSLPTTQLINGIIDPFVHVTEQYLTYEVNAPLQKRQAESILKTLIEEGPKALEQPHDYDTRANLMWCGTQALNGLVGVGVPQDWATHMIGHVLTARYNLDHAVTLAIVLPALLKILFEEKKSCLVRYGRIVWGLNGNNDNEVAQQAIEKTDQFFRSLGCINRLSEHNIIKNEIPLIVEHCVKLYGDLALGERKNINAECVQKILEIAY